MFIPAIFSLMIVTEEHLKELDQQPESVYVLHEKVERELPFHQHKKGQLTYTEGGIAYLYTKDKTYFIPARHYIWVPKGLVHFLRLRHPATVIRNLYFYAEDDNRDTFYSKLGIYPVNNLLLEMIAYSERWNGDICPDHSAYQFLAAIKNILPEINSQELSIMLPTTENKRMKSILEYINKHVSDVLTLENVSSNFALSERTLSRLFQSTISISFLQYLKQLRIVKAIEMLLQTDKSISEIAYESGYNSISAFSNTFYQLIHVRPTEFQKLKHG